MTKPASPDKPGRLLSIATAQRRDAAHWRNSKVTWGEIIGWAAQPADRDRKSVV